LSPCVVSSMCNDNSPSPARSVAYPWRSARVEAGRKRPVSTVRSTGCRPDGPTRSAEYAGPSSGLSRITRSSARLAASSGISTAETALAAGRTRSAWPAGLLLRVVSESTATGSAAKTAPNVMFGRSCKMGPLEGKLLNRLPFPLGRDPRPPQKYCSLSRLKTLKHLARPETEIDCAEWSKQQCRAGDVKNTSADDRASLSYRRTYRQSRGERRVNPHCFRHCRN
jgi:hypothetical protein